MLLVLLAQVPSSSLPFGLRSSLDLTSYTDVRPVKTTRPAPCAPPDPPRMGTCIHCTSSRPPGKDRLPDVWIGTPAFTRTDVAPLHYEGCCTCEGGEWC